MEKSKLIECFNGLKRSNKIYVKNMIIGSLFSFLILLLVFGRVHNGMEQSPSLNSDIILRNTEIVINESIVQKDEMDRYYDYYKISQFYPTIYYSALKYDLLTEQEADMILGEIVIIEPDLLVTYDSERALGTKEEMALMEIILSKNL